MQIRELHLPLRHRRVGGGGAEVVLGAAVLRRALGEVPETDRARKRASEREKESV